MLAPEEMTADGGIDLTLLVLDDQRLAEIYSEEHDKLSANGIVYEQQLQVPIMEVMARVIAIEKVLVDAELTTQDELNRFIVAFKITHMRMVAEQILPQIRAAQARSKIIQPGAPDGISLPGLGN